MKTIFAILFLIPVLCFSQHMTRTDKNFNGLRYIEYWPSDSIKGIILYEHGLGEVGMDLNMLTRHEIPRLIEAGKYYPYVIICPQLSKGTGYTASFELECVKLLMTYNITPRHVTGLSLGAQGTVLATIEAYKLTGKPKFFKTACTVSGKTNLRDSNAFSETKWMIYHGTLDTVFSIYSDELFVKYLDANGIYEKHEWINAGHACWAYAYGDDKYFAWLKK